MYKVIHQALLLHCTSQPGVQNLQLQVSTTHNSNFQLATPNLQLHNSQNTQSHKIEKLRYITFGAKPMGNLSSESRKYHFWGHTIQTFLQEHAPRLH